MRVQGGRVAGRCLRGECPNCGRGGLFGKEGEGEKRVGFNLRQNCRYCGVGLQEEHGLTLGTTSIGYVLALFVVLLPAIVAAVAGWVSASVAIGLGIAGSILLPLVLYPWLLRLVLAVWFGLNAKQLPVNGEAANTQEEEH